MYVHNDVGRLEIPVKDAALVRVLDRLSRFLHQPPAIVGLATYLASWRSRLEPEMSFMAK